NGVTAVLPCACWRIDSTRCRERILNDATFLRKMCVMQGRRFVQNAEKGLPEVPMKMLIGEIAERDRRDMTRHVSPLRKAEDAVLLDSSEMTIEEVVSAILKLAEAV
ncbi:MAG: (d)CMP kinase, partial [bacterium]